MRLLRKITLLIKEIGLRDLASYAFYAFQVRSGIMQLRTPLGGSHRALISIKQGDSHNPFHPVNWQSISTTGTSPGGFKDSGLLLEGSYRPFRGAVQKLDFAANWPLDQHWTKYQDKSDIKLTWEPARFLWALDLAKAYAVEKDERYPEIFWSRFEDFLRNNPVNTGPNWSSGQEAEIRLVMWILAFPAFRGSPQTTPRRVEMLKNAVVQHAERILPTRAYARSQHNNHVLSEALGLVYAGAFLGSDDPRSDKWIRGGISEFESAILQQVDNQGVYSQHSANYQRMMIQLAMLLDTALRQQGKSFSPKVMEKLKLATLWMTSQLDTTSGWLPNLGHNDGTLLLPFGSQDYRDYRPTVQAASRAFIGIDSLPAGEWNELSDWLGLPPAERRTPFPDSPAIQKVGGTRTWASLRSARFTKRPAHADQLHAEIWHDGVNLARDAGTYLYNDPAPWQNPFDRTRTHNTVTVDEKDQMERVSRFLWLDQAQATWLKCENPNEICASHDGYRRFGITHIRSLKYLPPADFLITDRMVNQKQGQAHAYCLHWLLPDWEYQLDGQSLTLLRGRTAVLIKIKAWSASKVDTLEPVDVSLLRAGVTLNGTHQDEILGWESNTYNEKHPALSYHLTYRSSVDILIETAWTITDDEN